MNIKILIDWYFKQSENDRQLTKALETYLCHDSYAMVSGWPIKDAVYSYLTAVLWDYWYDNLEPFYSNWYDRHANTQDLIDIWYFTPIGDARGNWSTAYKVNKEIDPKQAKSYKEYHTFEETFNLYYPNYDARTN